MKLKERILVTLSLFFWGTLLFWFFGGIYFYVLPILGIVFIVIGGKKHA